VVAQSLKLFKKLMQLATPEEVPNEQYITIR